MEYIFSTDSLSGLKKMRTKGDTHSELSGFCEILREYDDSNITDSFFVVEKFKSTEDDEGNCYDWYVIDKHNRIIDKAKLINKTNDLLDSVILQMLEV